MVEIPLSHVQLNHTRGHKGHLFVPRHQGQVLAAAEQITRNAIRLVGRLDEKLRDAPDEVALGVIGLSAQQFCGMQRGHLDLLDHFEHGPVRQKTRGRKQDPTTGHRYPAGCYPSRCRISQ